MSTVNLNQLLINTLHAKSVELETPLLVPKDGFYYLYLANIREAVFFGTAVTINKELIASTENPTSLTCLLDEVDGRMGL